MVQFLLPLSRIQQSLSLSLSLSLFHTHTHTHTSLPFLVHCSSIFCVYFAVSPNFSSKNLLAALAHLFLFLRSTGNFSMWGQLRKCLLVDSEPSLPVPLPNPILFTLWLPPFTFFGPFISPGGFCHLVCVTVQPKSSLWEFSGCPEVRTPGSCCQGPGFNPW